MSELERALVDLGRHLRYPPVPDVAPSVRAAVERAPGALAARTPRVRRAAIVAAAAVLALLVGLAAASPAVRAAIVRTILLPGVRIVVGVPEGSAPVRPIGRGLGLGEPASVEQAQREVGFPVRLPHRLGEPDEVYLDRSVPGGRVNLVWAARPGLPRATETGLGVLLTQFRADEGDVLLKKLADDPSLRPTTVRGRPAWWVEGPHPLMLVGPGGEPVLDSARTAGNTLLWTGDDVTFRLESALDLEGARRIAESIQG